MIETNDKIYILLKELIEESINKEVHLAMKTDLTKEGMNSLTLIEMIVELEDQLSIEILDDDLTLENFSTIESIINLLTEKYGVSRS
ncbi:phosphopantetheine-binding protein [Bacillus sp. MUM 13]|uniref:acyl carrier protein n=1 Tax=Bacillus sp. MUM 13 TaxID=1678001 RepID=UPI00147CC641|nr:phosphopantetheine-binding protein [Bacillus sp. MUM 13]